MLKAWCIFYDDDTTHLDVDGEIVNHHGVICITQCDEKGTRNIQQRRDYYVLTDTWIPCDTFGVLDHVMHRLNEVHAVIAGRTVSNAEFERIYLKAKEWRS